MPKKPKYSKNNECMSIPFYNVYRAIMNNFQNINVWSYEYIVASFIRMLRLPVPCKIDANIELRNVAENLAKYYMDVNIQDLLSKANMYLQEIGNALCCLGYDVREFEVELKYRGNVGVSSGFGQLLFEWGVSFDPYLNLPYIPASSIKGAIRTAFRYICNKHLKNNEKCNEKIENIFGSSSKGAGLLMFTDAYPIRLHNSRYILIPDVVTSHYNSDELEYEKDVEPNPVIHLSINKGVVFKFLMYCKSRKDRKINYNDELIENPDVIHSLDDLKLIDKAVFLAFGLGVGAKTLTGYSQFRIKSYRKICGRR